MRKPRALAAAVAVALGITGCESAAAVAAPLVGNPASRLGAVSPRPYGAADLTFGLDLLGARCRSQPRSNIVFSPASLATGLGLAYLGARGQTAAAMTRTLHLPTAGLRQAEAGMRARQAALGGLDAPGATLADGNRVWSDPSLLPLRSYLDAAATADHAGLSRVPLLSDPAKATQIINAAIAGQGSPGWSTRLRAMPITLCGALAPSKQLRNLTLLESAPGPGRLHVLQRRRSPVAHNDR